MKKIYVIGSILLVILLAVIGYSYYSLVSSPTVSAQLLIDSGSLQVDQGNGYQTVTMDMKLKLNDKVKNLDAQAAVVLHESVVIDLEPGTEVLISDLSKEHVKINQPEGSTWNKFTKLSGVTGFSVETPVTVATARGTEFGVSSDEVLVANGTVEAKIGDQSVSLNKFEKSEVVDGVLQKGELTEEDKARIIQNKRKMIKHMQNLRLKELKKHDRALKMWAKRYNKDEQDLKDYLKELDTNDADLDEIAAQAPVKMASIDKVKDWTEQIRSQHKQIEELQ